MEKLLSFYRGLSSHTRFYLIFFVLASLVWVPVRMDTGVEVYEPYKYDIDNVGDNQVVFAYRYSNFAWGEQDYLWVIQKDGTCRRKDLVKEAETLGKLKHKSYEQEELTEKELLERVDNYMQDETLPQMSQNFMISEEKKEYCINVSDITLGKPHIHSKDGGEGMFYLVSGIGSKRHLILMEMKGDAERNCGDLWIYEICEKIQEICRIGTG